MLIANKQIEMCRQCFRDFEYDDIDICKVCHPRKDKVGNLPYVETELPCPVCKIPSKIFCTYNDKYACADCVIKKQKPKYFLRVNSEK